MTLAQQRYQDGLIERTLKKTPGSRQRTAAARASLADPRAVAGFRPQWKEMVYPLVTERAMGSRLIDVDGHEYIDMLNGFGCILFGHSPRFVVDAAKEQLDRGVAIGPQSDLAGEVAAMICEMTGTERATFCNTGSEAVMAALRLARTVTGRDRVVYFTGDYHGTFDEVLVRSTPRGTMPVAPGIPAANVANVTVLEYGAPESLDWLRQHSGDLAAVLIEPVQTRHPEVQPIEFLREVRRITQNSGTCMILDEVVTGFRLAPGGFQQWSGIRADLCTYGKVLGGGHPLGVLAGSARFMDALDGGMWNYGDSSVPETGMTFFAGTFVRHPLALAAARAVLKHLQQAGPSLQKTLNAAASSMVAALNGEFAGRGIPFRVHGFASWFYIHFPSEWKLAPLFYYAMRERGVHIQEGFPCYLTTAHTQQDLQSILEAFREVIGELHEAGILPGDPALAAKQPLPEESASADFAPAPGSVPLTAAQREIYFAVALSDEANCAFNESLTLTLEGPLHSDALRFALDAVLARHDALRSTVDPMGDLLLIAPAFSGEVEWIDLHHASSAEQEAAITARTQEDAATPFDLHGGPLVRVVCFQQAADRCTVLLTGHHMVLDGWSGNILLEEIAAVYSGAAAAKAGRDSMAVRQLPPSPHFSSYALAERERREKGKFAQNETYWRERFQHRTPQLNLPLDRSRPAMKTYAGATVLGTLPADLVEAARSLAARSGCSLFAVLLSSFQWLLHRLSRQEEVVVGISAAGQSLLDNPSLVGHCVYFLPMLSEGVQSPRRHSI